MKATKFIVAIQDHFIQKYSQNRPAVDSLPGSASPTRSTFFPSSPARSGFSDGFRSDTESTPALQASQALQARRALREPQDKWAVEYITLTRMRPILEAFDDDASGWISVKEANAFTVNRPRQFSVVTWLAYWAAGA